MTKLCQKLFQMKFWVNHPYFDMNLKTIEVAKHGVQNTQIQNKTNNIKTYHILQITFVQASHANALQIFHTQ